LRATAISADDVRVFRAYKPRSAEVYGEANPIFVNQVARLSCVFERCVFIDLGSGIGTIAMQVAAMTGKSRRLVTYGDCCDERVLLYRCCVGCRCKAVEIRPELDAIAKKLDAAIDTALRTRGWTGGLSPHPLCF
jgi:hypothetical protein